MSTTIKHAGEVEELANLSRIVADMAADPQTPPAQLARWTAHRDLQARLVAAMSQPKMMITLESDHVEVVARLICSEVLGQRSSVSVAGRLGVEIMLGDIALDDLSRLRKALRANGHRVWTTRTRIK